MEFIHPCFGCFIFFYVRSLLVLIGYVVFCSTEIIGEGQSVMEECAV